MRLSRTIGWPLAPWKSGSELRRPRTSPFAPLNIKPTQRLASACALGLLLLATGANSLAQDDEAAALGLADRAPESAAQPRSWRLFAEGAMEQANMHFGLPDEQLHRATIDLQVDQTIAAQWRVVLADRLDMGDVQNLNGTASISDVNTLKEVYASWAAQTGLLFDAGRINPRLGAAAGYNPTDEFRSDAVRSVDSSDPVSLRENRMGSVMIRGQSLWTGGSLTALFSPKLDSNANTAGYNVDLGATNHEDRWMLIASEQVTESVNPQLLLWREQDNAPQFGLNLTGLLGTAAVTYLECSAGRSPSLAAEAMVLPRDTAFRSRLAGGVTYTFENKLSLTAEYEYSGAGMDASQWRAVQAGPLATYLQLRVFAFDAQDMVTRRAAFVLATWEDAGIRDLDLKAWTKFDLIDRSRMIWLEARYHWSRIEAALQLQYDSGTVLSDFGALPQARIGTALIRYYF